MSCQQVVQESSFIHKRIVENKEAKKTISFPPFFEYGVLVVVVVEVVVVVSMSNPFLVVDDVFVCVRVDSTQLTFILAFSLEFFFILKEK